MAQFKDKAGRSWVLDLDLTLADDILAATGVDLIDAEGMDKTFADIAYGNPRKVADLLWGMCREQAEKQRVEEKDFRRAINGAALQEGTAALMEAVAGFSQRPELVQVKLSSFRTILEKGDAAMRSELEKNLTDLTSVNAAGNSSGPSGSSPDGSPSAG